MCMFVLEIDEIVGGIVPHHTVQDIALVFIDHGLYASYLQVIGHWKKETELGIITGKYFDHPPRYLPGKTIPICVIC